MGGGTGSARWVEAPKQWECKIIWKDGSDFIANLNQQNIDNMKEVAAVVKVEIGDEV